MNLISHRWISTIFCLVAAKNREYFVNALGKGHPMQIPEKNPTVEEILASLPFTPAPRITEADEKDDRASLERKLVHSLFLVVKRNREDNAWQFPQGKLKPDENLRAAAERICDRATGKCKRWFISNAPIGHFCYEYPDAVKAARNEFGAKIFFYRAQLLGGGIKLETRLYTDYAWIARSEVKDYFGEEAADFMHHLLLD
jgi:large subunit ribosomal protein L46